MYIIKFIHENENEIKESVTRNSDLVHHCELKCIAIVAVIAHTMRPYTKHRQFARRMIIPILERVACATSRNRC
jgi:hypothetical protein